MKITFGTVLKDLYLLFYRCENFRELTIKDILPEIAMSYIQNLILKIVQKMF